jgi:hypothetical protein
VAGQPSRRLQAQGHRQPPEVTPPSLAALSRPFLAEQSLHAGSPFLAPFSPSSLFMRGSFIIPSAVRRWATFFLLFCLRVSISPGEITERYRPPD